MSTVRDESWRPGRGADSLAAAGVIGLLAVYVLTGALRAMAYAKLWSEDGVGADVDGVYETLALYSKLFPAFELGVAGVFVAGVLLLARRSGGGVAAWSFVAAASLVLVQGISAWSWIDTIGQASVDESFIFSLFQETPFRIAFAILSSLATAVGGALVIARRRGTAGSRAPLALYVALVGISALSWVLGAARLLEIEDAWLRFAAHQGPLAGALAVLVQQVLGKRAAEPAQAAALDDPSWERVASGLSIYGSALLWKLAVTVGAYLLLFFAATARSVGLAKLIMGLQPFLSLTIAVAILVGIYRYALQPASSPARATAWIGFAAMVVAACLQAYVFLEILPALTADRGDLSAALDARDAAERAQGVAIWAMGVGFAGLLLLLVSFAQLAHHLRRPDLAGRVGVLMAILLCAGAAIVWLRDYLQDVRGNVGEVAVLGIVALVGGAAVLFTYVRLVGSLEAAVREGAPGQVPPARVV